MADAPSTFSILMGSGVVAAIVAGAVSIITNVRNSKLKYVTEERQEWRKNIRDIVPKILSSPDENIRKELLERLYLSLNPNDDEDKKIINLIEHGLYDLPYEIHWEKKEEFRERIQYLLKYEWEKAKYEAGLSFSLYEFLLSATLFLIFYTVFSFFSRRSIPLYILIP